MDLGQIRKGSTRTLILALLLEEPMYGYQIARELERRSDGYFGVGEGLLYPALHQMERAGLLTSEWRARGKRRRRYYAITAEGRNWLSESGAVWRKFIAHLERLMRETGAWADEDDPGAEVDA
jgi:DNA-binding PadR family transcriptional regulator